MQPQHDGSAPRGTPPKFGPNVTHPAVGLSVGDIRSQIAAEWLQIVQRSQGRAYRKPPSLLMVPSLTPYDLPFLKNGVPYAPNIRERRIERRYLRFEQIQDGGHRHVGKISSGDISTTIRPIHFMFCSRVGFSGTADLMVLFSIRTNSRWRRLAEISPPYLRQIWRRYDRHISAISPYGEDMAILNGHISATAHDLLIQRASRGHLCDSTAFLFRYASLSPVESAPFFIQSTSFCSPISSWFTSSHITSSQSSCLCSHHCEELVFTVLGPPPLFF